MRGGVVVRGPRDVPALRRQFVDLWQPGNAFDVAAAPMAFVEQTDVASIAEWERTVLGSETLTLWWVSADMCDVLQAAERSVPDDVVLDKELVPRSRALVVFERPLSGLDANTGTTMLVNALVWGGVTLKPLRNAPGGPAVGLSWYQRLDADDGLGPAELERAVRTGAILQASPGWIDLTGDNAFARLHGDIWLPVGRADWMVGCPLTHKHHPAFTDTQLASIIEDRRRVAALWLLITQEGLTTQTTDHGSRGERRREQRAGYAPSPVVIVDVRRSPRSSSSSGDDAAERRMKVRYLVSGHWRRQAYGPKWSQRRPVWISPHVRGPEDAPLSKVERVRVVRPQESDQ